MIRDIVVGQDLRTYVLQLLEKQKKLPKLIDYLASLWSVAENYKNVKEINFALIAKMLEEAFVTPPKKIDWKYEKSNKKPNHNSIANTKEYYDEIKSYTYFERSLINQLLELKNMNGFFKNIEDNHWKNQSVETYLDAGTYYLEQEDEIDEEVSWYDVQAILHQGKNTE